MGRRLALVTFCFVAVAFVLAVGSLVARAADNQAALAAANPAGMQAADQASKSRIWYDIADVGLRIATLVVLSAGLVGTFAVLTSLRASSYSQIYTRFQGLLLKLADNPELFDRMKAEEYTAEENDPTVPAAATNLTGSSRTRWSTSTKKRFCFTNPGCSISSTRCPPITGNRSWGP